MSQANQRRNINVKQGSNQRLRSQLDRIKKELGFQTNNKQLYSLLLSDQANAAQTNQVSIRTSCLFLNKYFWTIFFLLTKLICLFVYRLKIRSTRTVNHRKYWMEVPSSTGISHLIWRTIKPWASSSTKRACTRISSRSSRCLKGSKAKTTKLQLLGSKIKMASEEVWINRPRREVTVMHSGRHSSAPYVWTPLSVVGLLYVGTATAISVLLSALFERRSVRSAGLLFGARSYRKASLLIVLSSSRQLSREPMSLIAGSPGCLNTTNTSRATSWNK